MNTSRNNTNLNRITRKCSFCRCEGHNISSCNNDDLAFLNNYFIFLKNSCMERHSGNRILAIQNFEIYIYDFCSLSEQNIKWIKSVACRFYNNRMRCMLQVAINKIILSLYNIDIYWITHHEYNFIPFNMNTPVRISYVLNGILMNFASNNIINNNVSNYKIELSKLDDKLSSFECSICYNTIEGKLCGSFECKHEYCIDCIEQLVNKKHTSCPYCRGKIENITCHSNESYDKLNKLINSSL